MARTVVGPGGEGVTPQAAELCGPASTGTEIGQSWKDSILASTQLSAS